MLILLLQLELKGRLIQWNHVFCDFTLYFYKSSFCQFNMGITRVEINYYDSEIEGLFYQIGTTTCIS